MNRKFKRTEFVLNKIFCNCINVFTDTFKHNLFLLNTSIYLKKQNGTFEW